MITLLYFVSILSILEGIAIFCILHDLRILIDEYKQKYLL